MARGERIGLMGGTFDPIHHAHLALASAGLNWGLDRVLMVVANDPWQKRAERAVSSAEVRFAAVEAAVADIDGVEASSIELNRGGVTYTVDTLETLIREDPSSEFFLIVGSDTAAGLETWVRSDDVASLVTVMVADRPGVSLPDLSPKWQLKRLFMEPLDVSSTELRRRLMNGESVDNWVPKPALAVYDAAGLYA